MVQFADASSDSQQAHSAISLVKAQLQKIGVKNIQVIRSAEKSLRITYYSETDVSDVKDILSLVTELDLDHTPIEGPEFPSNKNTDDYNVNVYEIHEKTSNNWGLDAIFITELRSDSVRFFTPKIYPSTDDLEEKERIEKIAYRVFSDIAIAKDNTSHAIPEVRAGPILI